MVVVTGAVVAASPYCVQVVPKLSVARSVKEYFAPKLIDLFSQIGDSADAESQSEAGSEK